MLYFLLRKDCQKKDVHLFVIFFAFIFIMTNCSVIVLMLILGDYIFSKMVTFSPFTCDY